MLLISEQTGLCGGCDLCYSLELALTEGDVEDLRLCMQRCLAGRTDFEVHRCLNYLLSALGASNFQSYTQAGEVKLHPPAATGLGLVS